MKTDKRAFQFLSRILLLVTGLLLSPQLFAVSVDGIVELNDTEIFSLFIIIIAFLLIVISAQAGAIVAIVSDKNLWKKKINGKGAGAVVGFFFLMASQDTQAAVLGSNDSSLITMTTELYYVLYGIVGFLLGVVITLYYIFQWLVKIRYSESEDAKKAAAEIKPDAFEVLSKKLITDAVPIEQEAEIMLDHDYDGIKELDNNLPPWWKIMFYISILFAPIYIIYYHGGAGELSADEYKTEMRLAAIEKEEYMKLQAENVDERTAELQTDPSKLALGETIYMENCMACHGVEGQGMAGLGPNFTDQYWIHGGGIKNVFSVIKYGIPQKGMIAWEAQLSPAQIQDVASYILSLQGTSPENAREPQGEIWQEEGVEMDTTAVAPADNG